MCEDSVSIELSSYDLASAIKDLQSVGLKLNELDVEKEQSSTTSATVSIVNADGNENAHTPFANDIDEIVCMHKMKFCKYFLNRII